MSTTSIISWMSEQAKVNFIENPKKWVGQQLYHHRWTIGAALVGAAIGAVALS